MKFQTLVVSGIVFLFAVAASGSLGFTIGKSQAELVPIEGVVNLNEDKPQDVDFSLFWEAWITMQERFAGADNLNYEDLVQGAIRGMVESVGDPYTTFMSAQETNRFLGDLSGRFEGVGMEIGIRDGELTVIAPLDKTPAQKAGLRAGDKILQIDETSTTGLTVDEAVSLIRGPSGTKVHLSIARDGWDAPRDFEVARALIEIPTVTWELKEGNVAYVRLSHFSEKATADFRRQAQEILDSSADRIILDLRNNPGGFLEVSVELAGWFLPRGSVVVIEDFGGKREQEKNDVKGNEVFTSYPMVVLMNEGSASASEILAGALRDVRNIQLIGTKSFGKGSVQELERLSDNSALKVTVAHWLSPNGILINDIGLEPDVLVEMTAEDIEQGKDLQLDKALEVVQNL